MKRLYSIIALITVVFVLSSCSDDNSTNPNYDSALKGTWAGSRVILNDSLYYEVSMDENNGVIAGNSIFYSRVVLPYMGGTFTQVTQRKGTIKGNYNKPSLKIEFLNDTTYFFLGNLTNDSIKISGKLEIINEFTGEELKYDLDLEKK